MKMSDVVFLIGYSGKAFRLPMQQFVNFVMPI